MSSSDETDSDPQQNATVSSIGTTTITTDISSATVTSVEKPDSFEQMKTNGGIIATVTSVEKSDSSSIGMVAITSQFANRNDRRAVIMNALQIVTSISSTSTSCLDSFSFERPKSSTSSMLFTTNSNISIDLLPSILMAWNRDESISFSGYVASPDRGPIGTAPLPVKKDTADEATFRSLLVRQLKGLLGCSPNGTPILPSWRKNMRGEFTLSLD